MTNKISIDVVARLREEGYTYDKIAEIIGVNSAAVRRKLPWVLSIRVCGNCHKSFESVRGDAAYCSSRCRMAVYRKRKRET